MIAHRGAVLVESAFAVSLILLAVYGSIQLGMVGLEQLTVDGGAYTVAHQQALLGANKQGYEDAPTLAKAALPHLNAPNVSVPQATYGQPPTAEAPSVQQYNLNNSNARHGGVSMIQPVQTVSFVSSSNLPSLLLGAANNISVSGVAIDPAFQLINGHGDIGGNAFGSPAAFATRSDPFVDGNNAPPYFIGFNYMKTCPYTVPANSQPWTTCPAPKPAGLGLAEYLDVNNWGRQTNGVVPDGQAVFYEARLHQNKFAAIAMKLGPMAYAQKAGYLDTTGNGPPGCVYSFDNPNLGSYTIGTVQIGDYPLHPAGDPAKCSGP